MAEPAGRRKRNAAVGCCADFAAEYALNEHPAFRELEREVLGSELGGTSWTTRDQADAIPQALGLAPDVHLLALGSGSGWPAVYLAERTGCRVTLLDLPMIALKQAGRHARERDLKTVAAVAADGASLPFADASFHALEHSDVLCCLPEKHEMLLECRRVARPGANMLFFVIAPGRGVTAADRDAVIEIGPPFVETDIEYPRLLAETGWRIVERRSLDETYESTLRRLVQHMERNADPLTGVLGQADYEKMLDRRRRQADAVARGWLARDRYLVQAR